jgi:hypothetical protein
MSVLTMTAPNPLAETQAQARSLWISMLEAQRLTGQTERFILAAALSGEIRSLSGPRRRFHRADCVAVASQIFDPRNGKAS